MSRASDFDVVGINNFPYDAESLVYLLKYDSTYGNYPGEVKVEGEKLLVGGRRSR